MSNDESVPPVPTNFPEDEKLATIAPGDAGLELGAKKDAISDGDASSLESEDLELKQIGGNSGGCSGTPERRLRFYLHFDSSADVLFCFLPIDPNTPGWDIDFTWTAEEEAALRRKFDFRTMVGTLIIYRALSLFINLTSICSLFSALHHFHGAFSRHA